MVFYAGNFIFLYAIVVNFSSLTLAPWTEKPTAPEEGTIEPCYYWLMFHGFKTNNFENMILAYRRDTNYDHDVSYFAAGFAYLLTNTSGLYDINQFGPSEFCGLHTVNYVSYPFITLKDAEFTCEGWIDFYLYIPHRDRFYVNQKNYFREDTSPEMYDYRFRWAEKRVRSMDNKISLWAAKYFEYITETNPITTPRDFCKSLGYPVLAGPYPSNFSFMTLNDSKMACKELEEIKLSPTVEEHVLAEEQNKNVKKMPFVTLGTSMTCYEWIKQSGFTDSKLENLQMIQTESVDENSVNYLSRWFIAYVKERHIIHTVLKARYEEKLQKQLEDRLKRHFQEQLQLEDTYHNQDQLINNFREQLQLEDTLQLLNPGNILDILMTVKEYCDYFGMPVTELANYYGQIVISVS